MLTASYIIAVVAVTNIGTGRIMPSDGSAKFQCEYTAVVMKPFKGEVVDGKVTIVNKVSFFLAAAFLAAFEGKIQ